MIPIELIDSNGKAFGVHRVSDKIDVLARTYEQLIVEDKVEDHHFISKFGHDSDATNADIEVWDGSIAYPYASSAETLYLSSTAAGDDQRYEVQGLDADWNMKTEEAVANGQNSVALSGTWIRTFRVKNLGTTDNAGTIHISTDSDASDTGGAPQTPATQSRAQITAGRNQTLMAIWSVPDGHDAYLTNYYASVAATTSRSVEVSLWVRPYGGVFQVKKIFSINSGTTTQLHYDFPLKIPQRSDVRVTANASGAAEVSAGFDAWYER
jgi:hypothetical protein